MSVLRSALLILARSHQVKTVVTKMPVSSGIVNRYVPGEHTEEAVAATHGPDRRRAARHPRLPRRGHPRRGAGRGDRRGVPRPARAARRAPAWPATPRSASSSPRSARRCPRSGPKLSQENARRICRAARNAGTTVTLDMEDHTTTDQTLATLRELRQDFPETGAVLQAYLHRTEQDCRALAHEGSRVRLCKGAYNEPEEVAFQDRHDVDKSYVRCLKILMAGEGYPMVATHDPRLVKIASALATRNGRMPGSYEFQMLFGIRAHEQKRLADARREGARLPALRRGVVRLPDEKARRAPLQPDILPAVLGLAEVSSTGSIREGSAMTVAIIGAGVMGETLLSGLLRGGHAAVRPRGRGEARRAGRRAAREVRRRGRRQHRRRGEGRHRGAGGQAAGHGRRAHRDRARSCAPASCWSAWRPASPPPTSRATSPRASPSSG